MTSIAVGSQEEKWNASDADEEEQDCLNTSNRSTGSTASSSIPLDHARKVFERECCREKTALDGSAHRRSRISQDTSQLSNCIREAAAAADAATSEQPIEEEASSCVPIKKQQGAAVSFSTVKISEYPIIVGDNPGGVRGCPLTIGWETLSSLSFDLNDYETVRTGHRRTMDQMRMTGSHREKSLRALGFSRQDIQWGVKHANVIRVQRRKTNELIKLDTLHANLELVHRRLRHVLTLGKQKRSERQFMRKSLVCSKQVLCHLDKDASTTSTSSSGGTSGSLLLDNSTKSSIRLTATSDDIY